MTNNRTIISDEGRVPLRAAAPRLAALFSGDLCPLNRYEAAFCEGRLDRVMPDILAEAAKADLHITNLETALTRRGRPIRKCGPAFRAHPGVIRGLRQLRISHACLANNHIGDYGPHGIADTLANLKAAGIRTLGIGTVGQPVAAPLLIRRNGVRLALINVAESEFSRPVGAHPGASSLDEMAMLQTLAQVHARSDARVVVFHGGREFRPLPATWIRSLCRQWVDAGATLVIAHHPHVPQGIEIRGRSAIVYSLGNFVFDYGAHVAHPATRLGYMVRAGFDSRGLTDLAVIPTYRAPDLKIECPPPDARARFYRWLNALSAPLADEPQAAALWDECVRRDTAGYLGAVARHLTDLERPAGERLQAAVDAPDPATTLYGLLYGCRTHREIVREAIRLEFEGRRASDPAARRTLDAWERDGQGLLATLDESRVL